MALYGFLHAQKGEVAKMIKMFSDKLERSRKEGLDRSSGNLECSETQNSLQKIQEFCTV
jgi:hypothetical protein